MSGQLQVSLIGTAAGLAAMQPEWTGLFYAAGTPDPFAHPIWMTAWARHFIRPSQLAVLAVRDGEGALVGVAPFYRREYRVGRWTAMTALQLIGSGQHMGLTELTEILIRPGLERPVLRALMHHLAEGEELWDWVELMLPSQQGWFEPQWLPDADSVASFAMHKATRACVLLPLPGTWEELRSGLKRNVKESLRRGANSLKREGYRWEIVVPRLVCELECALDELRALHGARSQLEGRVRHPDHLADAADWAFLRDAGRRMFEAGHLTPVIMRVDGQAAAARLTLHANGVTFLSISGFDARWWPYNVGTTLMGECLRTAIERGDRIANLSPGPDVAKLRWSERLDLYQEFAVVGPRRRSRLASTLFWQARALDLQRREYRRQRRQPPTVRY